MCLLFCNLQKRSLASRENGTLQTHYPLWSIVRLSVNQTTPHREGPPPIFPTWGSAEQLCGFETWELSILIRLLLKKTIWTHISSCFLLFCWRLFDITLHGNRVEKRLIGKINCRRNSIDQPIFDHNRWSEHHYMTYINAYELKNPSS
jgi:hypothetical protein